MRLQTLLMILASALMPGPERASAQEHDAAWVRTQIQRIRDSDTVAWRKIPWTASLTEARRVSAAEGRPMFLFTHDGNIETGRC